MCTKRDFKLDLLALTIAMTSFAFGCATGGYHSTTPEEHSMWRAAEAGNVEAQRRVAIDLSPSSPPGGAEPDAGYAAFWFKEACDQHYANAAVAFLELAEHEEVRTRDTRYVSHALACLHSAIEQGHSEAIRAGAIRATHHEKNFGRAYYLYALMQDADPEFADRRWEIADRLIQGEGERMERRATQWLTSHTLKSDDDFLRELNGDRG